MPKINAIEIIRETAGIKFNWKHAIYMIHAVTMRCNANCGFCAWKFSEDSPETMDTEEIKKMYSDARRAGFMGLSMWGGEPLLRRDIGELVQHAKNLGLGTNMVTNGWLLEKKMEDVVPYVDRICISLDFASEKHDEMRGLPGLYAKIIDSIRAIKAKDPKKKIVLVYTLMESNANPADMGAAARIARSLGAVMVYNPLRDEAGSEGSTDVDFKSFEAPDSQISEAYREVKRLKKAGYPILNSNTYIDKLIEGSPVYRCHWPKFVMPVEANGDVIDCMHWGTKPICNLRGRDFEEVLAEKRLHDLAGAAGEACHKCVSLHRIEVSEVWEGNLEPAFAWVKSLVFHS